MAAYQIAAWSGQWPTTGDGTFPMPLHQKPECLNQFSSWAPIHCTRPGLWQFVWRCFGWQFVQQQAQNSQVLKRSSHCPRFLQKECLPGMHS